ncbi:putative N-acetyltransferase YhbS [Umezawaea tangerina]|uniref:Putative N-acetyltransferase YhbS n=2 Tax=Umezawaea tangerina TaxID=84725 RepID=A0A2T0TAM4_9PSEU|nr:putative N-acetyltransferase YhbS [Umezawaea tangerina]
MEVGIRVARVGDVPAIVEMLADDPLGAGRERPGDPGYVAAFEEVERDPRQVLAVAVLDGEVVGTLQLTCTPGLSRVGMVRGTIEAVRVRGDLRGRRIGEALVGWALEEARRRGCGVVQLTTDASRVDAHRFYERLGFSASHVGMKLAL